MKARMDFVTNSSTSSYVIGVHGELTKERLVEAFGVPEGSLLYGLSKDLADLIMADTEERTREDILEDDGELSELEEDIFAAGMRCYTGYASSEGETLEQLLCYTPLYHKSDDLILDSGGGY